MKTFILSFISSFLGVITAIIFLIKLKINKKKGKKQETPNITKCGHGMMQGLCSEANIEKNQLEKDFNKIKAKRNIGSD